MTSRGVRDGASCISAKPPGGAAGNYDEGHRLTGGTPDGALCPADGSTALAAAEQTRLRKQRRDWQTALYLRTACPPWNGPDGGLAVEHETRRATLVGVHPRSPAPRNAASLGVLETHLPLTPHRAVTGANTWNSTYDTIHTGRQRRALVASAAAQTRLQLQRLFPA